jgi:hypothetical protein
VRAGFGEGFTLGRTVGWVSGCVWTVGSGSEKWAGSDGPATVTVKCVVVFGDWVGVHTTGSSYKIMIIINKIYQKIM